MRKLRNYLRNCWGFREELTKFRNFDYSYNLKLFKKSLCLTRDFIRDRGNEVNETRLPKVETMNRIIYLMDCFNKDVFTDLAEKQLGYKYSYSYHFEKINEDRYLYVDDSSKRELDRNAVIRRVSSEIEEEYWEELWGLLKDNIRGFWD